jgi:hypothetical protein
VRRKESRADRSQKIGLSQLYSKTRAEVGTAALFSR